MGHAHLGGKTVLYLIDGLFSGKHPVDPAPRKMSSPPFNGDWPKSLFASQDPVAIDSVGFDFLYSEYDDFPAGPAWTITCTRRPWPTTRPRAPSTIRTMPANEAVAEPGRPRALEQSHRKAVLPQPGHGKGIELVAVELVAPLPKPRQGDEGRVSSGRKGRRASMTNDKFSTRCDLPRRCASTAGGATARRVTIFQWVAEELKIGH